MSLDKDRIRHKKMIEPIWCPIHGLQEAIQVGSSGHRDKSGKYQIYRIMGCPDTHCITMREISTEEPEK